MKILFIPESGDAWRSGIWFHRVSAPATALSERGHHVRQLSMGVFREDDYEWPDVVIMGRTYYQGHEPLKVMREFQKRGKRVLYDMDDDFWRVDKNNPSVTVSNAQKDQFESLLKQADAAITPCPELVKVLKKFNKNVFFCPNGIDFKVYQKPINRDPMVKDELVIGYMGGSSHWGDLGMVIDALEELSTRHDFVFALYGVCGALIEDEMYHYQRYLSMNVQPERNAYFKSALDMYDKLNRIRMIHRPFAPPELHPTVLSRMSIDIGLAPLESKKFNENKSAIKMYEYAATGAVTIASDVGAYRHETNYRAKNTTKDWVKKLEKLIVDKEFREKTYKEQFDFVYKHRNIGGVSDLDKPEKHWPGIGLEWELACQLPEKRVKILNQQLD
jgi:glycosyltransferase involved in cell wall biosynthesis